MEKTVPKTANGDLSDWKERQPTTIFPSIKVCTFIVQSVQKRTAIRSLWKFQKIAARNMSGNSTARNTCLGSKKV